MNLKAFIGRSDCCPVCSSLVVLRLGRYQGRVGLEFFCLVCREQFIFNRGTGFRWVLVPKPQGGSHARAL